MKKLISTLIIVFGLSFTILMAQEKPYLVVDNDGSNYEVLLKLDDASHIKSVLVEGYYMVDGKTFPIKYQIAESDMMNFETAVGKVHTVKKDADVVVLNLKLNDKNGTTINYPAVELNMTSTDNLAKM